MRTRIVPVHAFRFPSQHQLRSEPICRLRYEYPSQLQLFRRERDQKNQDESENYESGSGRSRSYSNRRGGMLRKDVKKFVSGFARKSITSNSTNTNTNTNTNTDNNEDRHAWKKKKRYFGEGLPGFAQSAIYRYRGLKQKIRYAFCRNTVYVLECEGDKYYVGSTSNRKQRYREHFEYSRGGSKWTRLHKPIRVVEEYGRIPSRYLMGMEAQKTAETMIKHGVNNVRGASYSFARNLTTDDISSLTGFLGHYNQLNYKELSKELQKVLPRPDPKERSFAPPARNNYGSRTNVNGNSQSRSYGPTRTTNDGDAIAKPPNRRKLRKQRRKERALNKEKSKCYKCGQTGHWASECPLDNQGSSENQSQTTADKFSSKVDWSMSFEDSLDQWSMPGNLLDVEVPEESESKSKSKSKLDKDFDEALQSFFDSDSS
eukprot:jgi/Psemu1/325131/estExt_fgenesh1_pg.C_2090007